MPQPNSQAQSPGLSNMNIGSAGPQNLNQGIGVSPRGAQSPGYELFAGSATPILRPGVDPLPSLAQWNAKYIEYVLNLTKGKKTAAARILGINRRTLYRRKKAEADKGASEGGPEQGQVGGSSGAH
jgi:DNA-binding NtrC family response regulator